MGPSIALAPRSNLAAEIASWIGLLILISPYLLWARLTKIEHDDFLPQWEKDGRPHGMPFWFPVDGEFSSSFRSSYSILGTVWLFRTPEWIKESSKARTILILYRISSYFVYICVTAVCLLTLLLSVHETPH